jgi:hypothetical protein
VQLYKCGCGKRFEDNASLRVHQSRTCTWRSAGLDSAQSVRYSACTMDSATSSPSACLDSVAREPTRFGASF